MNCIELPLHVQRGPMKSLPINSWVDDQPITGPNVEMTPKLSGAALNYQQSRIHITLDQISFLVEYLKCFLVQNGLLGMCLIPKDAVVRPLEGCLFPRFTFAQKDSRKYLFEIIYIYI